MCNGFRFRFSFDASVFFRLEIGNLRGRARVFPGFLLANQKFVFRPGPARVNFGVVRSLIFSFDLQISQAPKEYNFFFRLICNFREESTQKISVLDRQRIIKLNNLFLFFLVNSDQLISSNLKINFLKKN